MIILPNTEKRAIESAIKMAVEADLEGALRVFGTTLDTILENQATFAEVLEKHRKYLGILRVAVTIMCLLLTLLGGLVMLK